MRLDDIFSVGDVVTLKAGGPKMTVERSSFRSVPCVWFDEAEELQRKTFEPSELERVRT